MPTNFGPVSNKDTHWHDAQHEELLFWSTPGAELGEQLKQLTYAKYLGIDFIHDGNSPYVIDKTGLRIVDVGGGPISLLLKTIADRKIVIDPCDFENWVLERYKANEIDWYKRGGETFNRVTKQDSFDEVWMYNVLQHTEDPQRIFDNIYRALKPGGVLRFLDWIDTPTNTAHPISLQYMDVLALLDKTGFSASSLNATQINENGAVGKIAYGIFEK